MIAKIKNIVKNLNDFQHPQIDVEVDYQDNRFDKGARLYVFTLPYDKFIGLTETELDELIISQGKNFKDSLDKGEETTTKEDNLKTFINKEITI